MSDIVEINLYCDEIKEVIIQDSVFGNEKWAYIGVLIVPILNQDALISNLLNKRCGNKSAIKQWGGCQKVCLYHEKNDKEVHYQKCDSADIYYIADRWFDFLLQDRKLTYFYVLGIDLSNLDYSFFGKASGKQIFSRIYNRFFRTAILKSVKSYFHRYDKIVVRNIVHDKTPLKYHELFPWHSIYRISRDDEKIEFHSRQIEFLESDHRLSGDERSHLIQYTDVILGSFYNGLHLASREEHKISISQKVVPLLSRLMNAPNNINSRYKYVGRQSIDFFPRSQTSLLELAGNINVRGGFYKSREIRINRINYPTLFDN